MASLSSQFHATLEELAEFVQRWMTDHPIKATAVEYFPFVARPLAREDIRKAVMDPRLRRIMFTVNEPNCEAPGNIELLDQNVGALILDIGRLGPRGLDESTLSTMDTNTIWKSIAKDFKRQTKAGAWAVHEENGASGRDRNRRYTAGAKALSESGIAMRQFQQTAVVFHFGDVVH